MLFVKKYLKIGRNRGNIAYLSISKSHDKDISRSQGILHWYLALASGVYFHSITSAWSRGGENILKKRPNVGRESMSTTQTLIAMDCVDSFRSMQWRFFK